MSESLEKLKQDRDAWKHHAEMFQRAWLREIGGRVIPKSHLIDGLVITTRQFMSKVRTCKIEWNAPPLPTVVCLCGSTRFGEAFQKANLKETLAGNIVLSIGCNMKSDDEIFGHMPQVEFEATKKMLDTLHFRKIDLCNEVLVLNVGGYIGHSTRNEIEYAKSFGKIIRYLEPQPC
jgi:hypothetical protein